MSGWLLFFLFLAMCAPLVVETKGATATVAVYTAWLLLCVSLLAAAMRTGGYL